MLSVVIPARNEPFLQKTIDDLLSKATGEIEIIAVLDGYWADPPLKDNPKLKIIHRGVSHGMRAAINAGVAIAKGEYILKADAHTMWDEGYDQKLIADCEPNWVVVPRRKRLDAENWQIQDVGKVDVDYEYLSFPDDPNDFGGPGLHGRQWNERSRERLDKQEYLIDDLMSFQGSAWFMKKEYFYFLELMDDENYGSFAHEAQEIGFKAWLSGGRVVVNKKTWYAHLHKGKKYGRGYSLDEEVRRKGTAYTNSWFLKQKVWHKQIHDFNWMIEKFMPVPGWSEDRSQWVQEAKIETPEEKIIVHDPIPQQGVVMLPHKREFLGDLFKTMGLKVGVEVGVEKGKFSEALLQRNPDMKLYCVDAWSLIPGYREHVSQEELDSFMAQAIERVSKYNGVVIQGMSQEVVKQFEDESLDFVYIDANHDFKSVTEDVIEWGKKVRKGGIISGHDYTLHQGSGVRNDTVYVMDAYIKAFNISPFYILTGDRASSWYFVKQ